MGSFEYPLSQTAFKLVACLDSVAEALALLPAGSPRNSACQLPSGAALEGQLAVPDVADRRDRTPLFLYRGCNVSATVILAENVKRKLTGISTYHGKGASTGLSHHHSASHVVPKRTLLAGKSVRMNLRLPTTW